MAKIVSPVGEIEFQEDQLLNFPQGLPGLPQCQRFVVLPDTSAQAEVPRVFVLQCVDQPDVAFSIVSPEALGVRYELELSETEVAALGLEKSEDLTAAVIVRRDEEHPESKGLRANFMGPILINVATRRGLQKVIDRFSCEVVIRG